MKSNLPPPLTEEELLAGKFSQDAQTYTEIKVPSAEEIHATALEELPSLLRRLEDKSAPLHHEAWLASQNESWTLRRLTIEYHERRGLGIKAAEAKAVTDESVIDAAISARSRWEEWQTVKRAIENVKQELRIRLSGDG